MRNQLKGIRTQGLGAADLAASMSGRIIRPGAMDSEHTWVLVKKRRSDFQDSCFSKSDRTNCPFYDIEYSTCRACNNADCQGTPLEGCPVHNNKQTQMGL